MSRLRSSLVFVRQYRTLLHSSSPIQHHNNIIKPVSRTFGGIFFSKMASGIEKDPAKDADPVLLEKARTRPKDMSDDDWRTLLTLTQYEVARGQGTERAWTGLHNETKDKGMFNCVCCNTDLFPSEYKFESGSGWPSFYDTQKKEDSETDNIERRVDTSFGTRRVEVVCKKCEAHLGHVFTDGPAPTGLRYCINSASLNFTKKKE